METIDEGLTTQPEPTLRDTLESVIADTDSAAPPEPTTPKPSDGSEAAAAETKADRLANRLRGADGKLLPGTKENAAAQESPKAAILDSQSSAPVAAAPKRPTTWGKETWPIYDKLAAGQPITPEEAKVLVDTIHKREGDYAKGVSTYKGEWESAKPLIDAVTPFMPELQQHGINPAQWIQNLGNAHRSLAMGTPQQQIQTVQTILANNRIPAQLAVQDANGQWQLLGTPQAPQQPQFDPSMIERLIETKLLAKSTEQEIQHFAAQADKYPHFETVKQEMAGILQAGLADDLEGAYNKAIRMHDEIWQQQQAEQSAAKASEIAAQQKAKVTRARANAISVPSTTPRGMTTKGGEKGLRETLEENFRAAEGRV